MQKITVGVFFGSRSAEHDVSIVTALGSVIKPLELSGHYRVVPVYITKDGRWFADDKLKNIKLFSSGEIETFLAQAKPVMLDLNHGLRIVKPGLKPRIIPIDVAFPATHGTYGEDGSLAGVFRMANVPFVGADLAASAVAMDKILAKQVASSQGIPVADWTWCTSAEFAEQPEGVLAKIRPLKHPLFVKPAHLGSSIGISKVSTKEELLNGLEVAAHYDDRIIIEQAVPNLIEVTVPVMGNDDPRPALVERPLSKADGVFDFDTKYMHQGKGKAGAKQGAQGYSQLPAEIPAKLYKRAEQTALAVYRAIGCTGLSRVDLLIDGKTQKVYFNELNPLPGDLYRHNWRAAGLSSVQLVDELVRLAQQRHAGQQKIATTFSTNFLKQF